MKIRTAGKVIQSERPYRRSTKQKAIKVVLRKFRTFATPLIKSLFKPTERKTTNE